MSSPAPLPTAFCTSRGSRPICIRKRARANARRLACAGGAAPGSAYIRAQGGARLTLPAAGSLRLARRLSFFARVCSALSVLVDNCCSQIAHDSGRSSWPGHGSRKHSQVGRRLNPDVWARGDPRPGPWPRWLGDSLWGPPGGNRLGWEPAVEAGASVPAGPKVRPPGLARRAGACWGCVSGSRGSQGTLRLTVLACPQDAGRRESVARAAVVCAAPRPPHGRRLRVSQSPERVSIKRGPWEERQGDRGDSGWGRPWLCRT